METISVWTTSSTPPATPTCNVDGETLLHVSTSTSRYMIGFLWWKRLRWKHVFAFKTVAEACEAIEYPDQIKSDATITVLADSRNTPKSPESMAGFTLASVDPPVQLTVDKWVHRFHYEPDRATSEQSP